MILLSNLLIGVASVLDGLLQLFTFLIIGRVIISWVNADPYNAIVRFIVTSTEPLFRLVRKYIPAVIGSLDLSPIIIFMLISFTRWVVVQSLFDYAVRLKQ